MCVWCGVAYEKIHITYSVVTRLVGKSPYSPSDDAYICLFLFSLHFFLSLSCWCAGPARKDVKDEAEEIIAKRGRGTHEWCAETLSKAGMWIFFVQGKKGSLKVPDFPLIFFRLFLPRRDKIYVHTTHMPTHKDIQIPYKKNLNVSAFPFNTCLSNPYLRNDLAPHFWQDHGGIQNENSRRKAPAKMCTREKEKI